MRKFLQLVWVVLVCAVAAFSQTEIDNSQLKSGGGGGGSQPCVSLPFSIQYNQAGLFGCAPLTFTSPSTLSLTSSGILNLSVAPVTTGLKLPSATGANPTADGQLAFDLTTHLPVTGSNGNTLHWPNNLAPVAHQYVTGYNWLSGAFLTAQPQCEDLSDANNGCKNATLVSGWTNSGVSAGTYTCATITVTATGVITSASGGTCPTALQGTTNQIAVTTAGGTTTISLPNPIITPGGMTVNGPTTLNGPNPFIEFNADSFCAFQGVTGQDQLCDYGNGTIDVPVWNTGEGAPNQQLMLVRLLPQSSYQAGWVFGWYPPNADFEPYVPITVPSCIGCTGTNSIAPGSVNYTPSTGAANAFSVPDPNFFDSGSTLNYYGEYFGYGLNIQGNGAGNYGFQQGPILPATPNTLQVIANTTEPVGGANLLLPSTVKKGVLEATFGTGAAGTVTCSGCGGLTTGNISISANGQYASPPACRVSAPPAGGTQAYCAVTALNGSGGVTASNTVITNPGSGYNAQATLTFSDQVELSIGPPFFADYTAQTAAISTTAFAPPAGGFTCAQAGQYRFHWDAKVTTAATSTSTLGPMTVTYQDPDGTTLTVSAAAQTGTGTVQATGATGNNTSTVLLGIPLMLNCAAGTNVSYAFGYASSGATAMAYNLHVRLDP